MSGNCSFAKLLIGDFGFVEWRSGKYIGWSNFCSDMMREIRYKDFSSINSTIISFLLSSQQKTIKKIEIK